VLSRKQACRLRRDLPVVCAAISDGTVNDTTTTHRARWRLLIIGVVVLTLAIVLWRFTPLAQWITPQRLSGWVGTFGDQPWAPFAIIGLFVVGGLIFFPVMLLIGVTALVLTPLLAFVVSLVGALASALTTYAVGARFVRGAAHSAFGPALDKVRSALSTSGIIAVAVVRTVPIAPFTVVNLAAGSIGVRLTDYVLGTALGLAPGLIAITAFGQQLRAILDHPTPRGIGLLVAIVVGWIALSLLLQRVVSRRRTPVA
jgi:phospholipase D1/2